LRRIRFLLLAIVILFGFFTPGELWWPGLASFSPSHEGSLLALTHAGRLLGVVALVTLLLHQLPVPYLLTGLCQLARPLAWFGIEPERLAVRLHLVMAYVEAQPQHDWRAWLEPDSAANLDYPIVMLPDYPWRYHDSLLLAGLFCGILSWGIWG
jgi:hypothetical protein